MQLNGWKDKRAVRKGYHTLNSLFRRQKLLAKIDSTFKKFGIDQDDLRNKDALVSDMLRMNRRYGYGFGEYLYYRFDQKPMEERLAFIADWERRGYAYTMNDPKNDRLFDNKWETYKKYNKYYGREAVLAEDADDPAYTDFAARHERFIIKPLEDSFGRGVRMAAAGEDLSDAFPFIAEELICQVPETAQFHPASVNSVRMPTIRTEEETIVFHPFFRIGRGGSLVDNGGAGGIISALDAETGTVIAAADELGRKYTKHPESGKQIVGFTIPHWKEAVAFVRELAEVTPENRYTGWDIALTEKGWVMVEANHKGQFIWQIPLQQGCRPELTAILARMGLKY